MRSVGLAATSTLARGTSTRSPTLNPCPAWFLDEKLVQMNHVGEKANFEQVMFIEGSLRGDFTVRVLDEDPEVGTVFVARWDFVLEA